MSRETVELRIEANVDGVIGQLRRMGLVVRRSSAWYEFMRWERVRTYSRLDTGSVTEPNNAELTDARDRWYTLDDLDA